ncbi:universal stress protein [Hymenobacter convexus]|uniref:universal stress protein n=1 Tax=Hymenobacter sp. CA1UV-4 TaxID=3063782 RepID=UPI002712FB06|nr:universal stress protein [Hymenobacter sp. CA1UV-4]MDO7852519.1 universal stress protein [Hymenobacter sp. CA1UV-4]
MKPAFIVLTDLTEAANVALAYTTRLAARLHGRLVLLHVYLNIDPLRDPEEFILTTATELAGRQRIQADLQRQARQLPVPTETELSIEPLATAVARAVALHHPQLLALGRAKPRTLLDRLLPHEAAPVLQAAGFPMLLVPEGWTETELPLRVMVAADGHPFALSPPALALHELLASLQASVSVVHVAPAAHGPSRGEQALESVRHTHLFGPLANNSLYEVREETPADGILHAAGEVRAQLLVLLARPHTFLGGLFHRSVTAQVLRRSPVPVLVLPTLS